MNYSNPLTPLRGPKEIVFRRLGWAAGNTSYFSGQAAPYPLRAAQPPGVANEAIEIIREWLESIGESDPETINSVLAKCEADQSAMSFFLGKASLEGVTSMKEITSALVRAQKSFGPATRNAANPHFRSRYADLAACFDAVQPALNENGIAVVQKTIPCENGVAVETIFLHESGEALSCGEFHVPATKSDPQGYGSALTYARRYSLMTACGIAPEDDDGSAARLPAIGDVLKSIAAASTFAEARSTGAEYFKRFGPEDQARITAAVNAKKGGEQ